MAHLTIMDACGKDVSVSQPETKENLSSYDIESNVESFHWWFAVRRKLLRLLLSSIDIPKNSLVLDVGCGTGSNLRTLVSAGLYPVGLDRSAYALKLARSKENFSLLAGDLNNLPIRTKSVGLIIATDILEHLENDSNGISGCYRVLREGGILILTVPAFRSLWGVQDVVTGHKRRYSKKEITDKLKGEGFDILRSSYFNSFLFFPILLARRIIRLLGLKIESENKVNSRSLNFILKTIFSIEPTVLRHFSFPFGVSIFCIAKK